MNSSYQAPSAVLGGSETPVTQTQRVPALALPARGSDDQLISVQICHFRTSSLPRVKTHQRHRWSLLERGGGAGLKLERSGRCPRPGTIEQRCGCAVGGQVSLCSGRRTQEAWALGSQGCCVPGTARRLVWLEPSGPGGSAVGEESGEVRGWLDRSRPLAWSLFAFGDFDSLLCVW